MIKKILSSQLRVNMASGVVTTLVNALVVAVGYPLYLHFLGYELYGVWLVLTTVLAFANLGNLGIGQAVTKLISEEFGRGNFTGIERYLTTALALLCLTGILILIALIVFQNHIIGLFKLSSENYRIVMWLFPYIGVLSIYIFAVDVFRGTLSGLGRMDFSNYIFSLGEIMKLAISASLLMAGLGIKSLLIGAFVGQAVTHAASFFCIRRIVPIRILHPSHIQAQYAKRLLSFGGGIFGASAISMLFSPFNKLVLSRYVGVSAIPVYEIAFTGSMQIRGLFEVALRALMPEISRIGATITGTAKNKILTLNRHAQKLIFLFGIPIYAASILLMPFLVKIWLGANYVETLPEAFQIMLVGTFLSLLCVPAYYTLMGLGKVRHCFLSQVVQGTVNAGIVGTLLAFWGIVSIQSTAWAAVAAMGATSLYVLYQNYRAMKKYHFVEPAAHPLFQVIQ
jgi:O-antigen/teichoic acid export membrane protein